MPRNGQMTEAELSSSLSRALAMQGFKVDRTWVSLHSPKGRPDLVAERSGLWVIAELKTDDLARSQPTPDQVEWLIRYTKLALAVCKPEPRMGVYLWRPADIEAAYQVILRQRPLDPYGWLQGSWRLAPVKDLMKADPLLMEGEIGRCGYPRDEVTPARVAQALSAI